MGTSFSKDHLTKNKYIKDCIRKFDQNELEVLHKIFKELSSRSTSAGIDKETFLQYFNLPGLWGEQLFRKFDINYSGSVELDEFLIGISVSCRGTRTEKIYVLFKLFDLNNDNLIHKFELLAMLSNFPQLTKYLYTSINNADSRFNARNRNLKMLDRVHKRISFNSVQLLYENEKDFRIANTPANNNYVPFKSKIGPYYYILASSNESNASRQSSYTDVSIVKTDKKNSVCDKISKSVSDFSHDTMSLSAYLNRYYSDEANGLFNYCTPCQPNHAGKVLTPMRSKSFSKTNKTERNCDFKLDKYKLKWESYETDSSNSSESNDEFNKSFVSSNSSHESWNEAEMSEINTLSHHDDPSSLVVMSIIQENEGQQGFDNTNLDLETLVDQIFEECEFDETGCLTFQMFKAWLEKNESILAMFSECLHEEVWGLQGHAFHHDRECTESFLENKYDFNYKSSTEFGKSITSDYTKQSINLDDITIRTIYHIFLVKDQHLFYPLENHLNTVVSSELLEHMKNINTGVDKEKLMATKTSQTEESTQTMDSEKFMYEIFACPNCKTPFLMCPVCYTKHNALSLHIECNNVYIKCSNCKSSAESDLGVFKSCWICCWSFNDIFNLPTLSKQQNSLNGLSIASNGVTTNGSIDAKTRTQFNASAMSLKSSKAAADALNKNINFNVTTKSGLMYKIGKTLHQWKSRYYVLVGNILYYYKDKGSTRPRGCIFLEGCYLDTLRKRQIGDKYGFSICHKGNKFSRRDFYVETMEEFLDWIEVLRHAMKQQVLSSMYEICEQLGQGKFSIVYRAIYKETGEEYAVKIIDKTKITHQERELLRSEISILKLLKHNNVIYLKDIIDMKDHLYIVMELVRGGELYDLLHSEHRLSEEHTHRIISQLLKTVAYLHKCGIIHRDLKPENLLLTDRSESGSIKLTDFGLSTLCSPNDILTQPCGTLAYVAPEVLTMQGYNQKSDVWSIGVIMYLLIRGRLPFAIKKSHTIHIWEHYKVTFDGSIWRGVSSSAKDLIRKLLEIDPAKRVSVFEALNHIWVKNFVAVNHDSPSVTMMAHHGESDEFYQSLRNTTDTTFVLPYSESCNRNLNKLQNVEYKSDIIAEKEPDSDDSNKRGISTVLKLETVNE
ncbi:myosin light chain kinase [Theileria orientalis strain Shintoku]|uniref:Myosin light chain kinase n=1 Tax=Theileria orientalis strain Shintoku TaxID=869250 RepID=J4DQ87_THEOR|nr:myosin light chain kinase [Theileria orientalis strain Shintoku]BAM42024.1 myosin light chain kinase [Theileria orientalis strain Shintoku]|eukprot:XP_009692325.1 myosin light chain kinase [Theileria orientalis strain Shintoku]